MSREPNGTPGAENTFAAVPAVAFNETSATTDLNFRVELHNYGTIPRPLGGMVIASSDPASEDYLLPPGSLAAGSHLTIDAATLGFTQSTTTASSCIRLVRPPLLMRCGWTTAPRPEILRAPDAG